MMCYQPTLCDLDFTEETQRGVGICLYLVSNLFRDQYPSLKHVTLRALPRLWVQCRVLALPVSAFTKSGPRTQYDLEKSCQTHILYLSITS